MTGQAREAGAAPIHSMEEFKRCFFPLEYAKEQREKRIEEVGFGRVMAEEALEKVFGPGREEHPNASS